jgi:hypothetical protein
VGIFLKEARPGARTSAMADRRVRFTAYGAAFAIRGGDGDALTHVLSRAADLGWIETAPGDVVAEYVLRECRSQGAWRRELRCDGAQIAATDDLHHLVEAFENHAKIQTAYRAEGCVFVHAGAVSWRGSAILLPGQSHTGKSTLVKALLDLGATYCSDEFAILDASGRVHPFPFPLSLRAASSHGAVRLAIAPGRTQAANKPVSIRLILLTRYRRGARWRPRPLSPARALLALMENTVAARRSPGMTMPILQQAVIAARAIQGDRGEACRAARALLAELS